MNTSDSLADIDVALAHAPYLRLLRRLPPEQTGAFLAGALAWEREHALAGRLARYRDSVHEVLRSVPSLSGDDDLAVRWAERLFERGRNVVLPLLYAEDDRIRVEVTGEGAELADRRRGQGLIAVSVHAGPYQALPAYLARSGHRVTSFMDAAAEQLISRAYREFVDTLVPSLEAIGLPAEDATRRALAAVRSGGILLMMPEFTLGELRTGRTHTVPFLGRRAYAPTGPARLARALRVPLLPVRLSQPAPDHFVIRFDAPCYLPGDAEREEVVTDRVFAWLEQQVEADPASWWCWEIFEELIAAPQAAAERPLKAASTAPVG
jgi:lauroyl/myristoyl acyltransferase